MGEIVVNSALEILNAISNSKQRKILSTIIAVKGSSYRKEGAMMLHLEDGTQIGLLSGGCLENDLAMIADEIIKEKQSRIKDYNMNSEEDLIFGTGSGCNGTISVLMEPLDHQYEQHLLHMHTYLKQRIPVLHIKKLSSSGNVSDYVFITKGQAYFGEWGGETPLQFLSLFSDVKKNGIIFERFSERYFLQLFLPKPRLIIMGATPDVRPLIRFAAMAGFHTIVTDWRPALCKQDLLLDADEIILDTPSSFLSQFSFFPDDSIIVMTHHFAKDQEILHILLQERLNYQGILGPRKRTGKLLEGEEIPDWFHSPVGLSIGSVGPEEIAISILADVIKIFRKRDPYDYWNLLGSG